MRGQGEPPGGPGKLGGVEPPPPEDLTSSEKYPRPVRLALIIGLPLALWVLIGAGAVWLLGSLWGRIIGIVVLGALAVAGILFATNQGPPNHTGRGDRGR